PTDASCFTCRAPASCDATRLPACGRSQGGESMRYRLTWAAAAALALPAVVTAATWDLDPAHSSVQFSVRHLMVSNVRGEFGNLTLHGVTRPVVLDVEGPTPEIKDPWGKTRAGAQATAKIDRKDFGIAWNQTLDAGGVAVGDEVTITIDVEATKRAAGGAAET